MFRLTITTILALVVFAGCGGSAPTTGPAGTGGAPAASQGGPAPTDGPVATVAPPEAAAEGSATLTIDGADVGGSWELRGGRSVKPTDTIAAAIFTETVDDVAAGHGDLITVSLGGTLEQGTRQTTAAGVTLTIGYSRIDAVGNDLFVHVWASADGSCDVTMAPSATGWAGSFTCGTLTDPEGHAISANGTFNT